jgi:MFS superfamily sulfate permease-like transporter
VGKMNLTKFQLKNVDFAASLVVFVVAIPLTLGISLASGVSVEAGIISAIIGGIIVGLFSGAPLMVSGPAAGLSAIVFQLVQDYGFSRTYVYYIFLWIISDPIFINEGWTSV